MELTLDRISKVLVPTCCSLLSQQKNTKPDAKIVLNEYKGLIFIMLHLSTKEPRLYVLQREFVEHIRAAKASLTDVVETPIPKMPPSPILFRVPQWVDMYYDRIDSIVDNMINILYQIFEPDFRVVVSDAPTFTEALLKMIYATSWSRYKKTQDLYT